MSRPINFKRGDTFSVTGVVKLNGYAQDMTGWTMTCQLRKTDPKDLPNLIDAISFTWVNPTAALIQGIHAAALTALWPLGGATLDIRFTSPSGTKTTTTSASIYIVEADTRI